MTRCMYLIHIPLYDQKKSINVYTTWTFCINTAIVYMWWLYIYTACVDVIECMHVRVHVLYMWRQALYIIPIIQQYVGIIAQRPLIS